MNLDFSRPTEKMRALAKEHNIDLTDPHVIKEFKKIQQQNLDDIRKLKEGKVLDDKKDEDTPEDISEERVEALLKENKELNEKTK